MPFDIAPILAAIPSRPPEKPFFIAIDGGSGSGKSTLGAALAAELSSPLLSLDDHLIPVPDEVLDRRDPERNFLEAFDLRKITALLETRRNATPPGTMVAEGVYSFRPEWRQYFDFRIWIEMEPSARLSRMKVRGENSESQMRLWQATEEWYTRKFDPSTMADLVLDGASGKILNKG